MDARRSQIYNALFTSEHGRLTRRTPDRAIGLAELAEELRSEPLPLVIRWGTAPSSVRRR